jgi:iron-sulfur cluster assembly accessory protein
MDTSLATQQPVVAPSTQPAEPVLVLTAAAVAQIREVIAKESLQGHYLTIRVVPAGCSGLGYDLNLLKETKPNDLVWEQDGISICTDALSAGYLKGTQMDYTRTDLAAGFKFENPNAKSSCGCGSSFST